MLTAIAVFTSGAVCAADYPTRSVRIIVPQSAGSGTDTHARAVAQKLTEYWGQQVIVDNRPGANGIIGIQDVAAASPDGYTLLYGFASLLAFNPFVYKSLPYDPVRNFVPITQTVDTTLVLVVNPSVPVRSVNELVALAKARPDTLTYGSNGNGNMTHLAAVLLGIEADVKMLHVPYKGESPAVTAVLGGEVNMLFANGPAVASFVRSGRLRALATAGPNRSVAFPDLPTVAEAGFPKVVAVGWGALLAPAGTPQDIIQKIQRDTVKALRDPEVHKRLSSLGSEPAGSTSEQFAAYLKAEMARWSDVIKGAGLFHSQ